MNASRITAQAAVLLVRDVPASIAWWSQKLGFANPSTFGDPPEFVIMNRDGARVMLGKAKPDHRIVPHWQARDGLCSAYFWVGDACGLFAEIERSGAMIEYRPELQSYGVVEFGVRDLDDHVISFGQIMPQDQPR